MTENKKFDLCVIGAGPGGYVAAIRGAQLGLKVGIIEANHLGGICLNWGCIPTKALLKSSELNYLLNNKLEDFGFSVKSINFDFDKIVKRSRNVSSKLSGGIAGLMKKHKIEVVDGFAKFVNSKKVSVVKDDKEVATVEASHFIVATGARARQIPGLEADGEQIWTYKEAMTPEKLPKSLLVIGSGAIGVEFASFYRNMGSEVTIVEMQDNILPVEDQEISKIAKKSFEKQGMKIITGAALKSFEKGRKDVTATIEIKGKSEKITAEKVIMAVGVIANTDDIGLKNTKERVFLGSQGKQVEAAQ